MTTLTRNDVINEALARADDLGFEMEHGGFTSHAPMAAEALISLGHLAEAVPWIERYVCTVPHLERPAPTGRRIDPRAEADWCAALGDLERLGDWAVLFQEEMEDAPWAEVLARWWPRLLPGFVGGLTHGLIRTAHAVRSLAADPQPTARERRELSDALAYWSVRYTPLPGHAEPRGARSVADALAALPALPPREIIGAQLRGLTGVTREDESGAWAGFDDAASALAPPADVDAALLALTRETADLLRNRAAVNPSPVQMIASVHTVTAPSAARMLLPHLPVETHLPTYARVWQTTAALAAAFTLHVDAPARDDRERMPLSPAELDARAVENGAAHAIKLTEASLREYRDNPDPVYLFMLEDVLPHIRATPITPGG
ncbi:MAG TPA: questin oxidase family protein [Chloroflexota bacterium]|jgi:hypothetical protein